MDLRFNNERLRQEIDNADFGDLDNNSLLVRDIKQDMHLKLDIIDELQKQKDKIDKRIEEKRAELKEIAIKWNI